MSTPRKPRVYIEDFEMPKCCKECRFVVYWEYDSDAYARKQGVKPTKDLITRMNKAFCKTIEKAGYVAGYYTNLDYEQNKIDCDKLTDYVKWYAQYADKAQSDYDLWQYSSKVKLAGITANTVDANKPSAEFRKQTAQAVFKFKQKYKLASKNGSHYGSKMYAKLKTLMEEGA